MITRIVEYGAIFLALLIVLPFHEFAHAFAAVKSGDNTPKLYNRYTLNPLAHFDIAGIICFIVARFGWAKPVPVNPNNFKHYKRDSFFVAVAGVLMNYILAFVAYPLFLLAFNYLPEELSYFGALIQLTLYFIYLLSINFFVFNLLPVYPLDGFRVVDVFVKRRGKAYYAYRTYGMYVLLGLVLLSFLAEITNIYYLDVLGIAMRFLADIISYPIRWIWGLVFA